MRIIIDIQYILEKLFSVWVFLAAANHKWGLHLPYIKALAQMWQPAIWKPSILWTLWSFMPKSVFMRLWVLKCAAHEFWQNQLAALYFLGFRPLGDVGVLITQLVLFVCAAWDGQANLSNLTAECMHERTCISPTQDWNTFFFSPVDLKWLRTVSQPHLEIQMCPSGCTNELLSPTIHMVYSHTVRATNWVAIMEIFEIQVKVAIFPLFRIQVSSSGLRLIFRSGHPTSGCQLRRWRRSLRRRLWLRPPQMKRPASVNSLWTWNLPWPWGKLSWRWVLWADLMIFWAKIAKLCWVTKLFQNYWGLWDTKYSVDDLHFVYDVGAYHPVVLFANVLINPSNHSL